MIPGLSNVCECGMRVWAQRRRRHVASAQQQVLLGGLATSSILALCPCRCAAYLIEFITQLLVLVILLLPAEPLSLES